MITLKLPPLILALLFALGMASAHADGTLTHMSGIVSVQKADGKIIPGTAGTKVLPGDTVITGAGGFVRMEMTDGGEMVMRPDSQLKIENYHFNQAKPAEDNFVFSMLKGGLRTVTGLVGKRGDRDAYRLKTETATIGIRGTQFDLRVCAANCGALPAGTYLAVRFGAVEASNAQGSLPVAAGQVAHVPPARAPVILPRDPGIGFTPPPVIPKLDEKKKIAAAAAAEQAKPAEAVKSDKAAEKPAEKSSDKSTDKSKSSDSGTKPGAKAEGEAKTEATGQAETSPVTVSAKTTTSALPSSVAPASGGAECSVQ